jgi:hypothetical protein
MMSSSDEYMRQYGEGPRPRGVGDNNRPRDVTPQMKNKVFQNAEEIFNQPGKSNHGAIYISGTHVNGVPDDNDRIVSYGPFRTY